MMAVPTLAFIALVIASLIIMSDLINGIQSINNDRVIPLKQIKVVSDNYAVNIVDDFHKFNAGIISKKRLFDNIKVNESSASLNWQAYLATKLTKEENRLASESSYQLEKVMAFINKYKNKLQSNNNLENKELFIEEMYQTFDPFSLSLNKLINLQLKESESFASHAQRIYKTEKQVLIIVCMLLLITSLILGTLINRSIIEPIKAIEHLVGDISKTTDLTLRAKAVGTDEFSQTALSINLMLSRFHELIKQLTIAANTLGIESLQMQHSSNSVASTTVQQEQQTLKIASSITEMSSAIGDVASTAVITSEKATISKTMAKEGLIKVTNNINAINQLNEIIGETKIQIDQLSQQTNEINDVVQIIQGVAEQTNLLALNAAIEAARAGESGRGFAVVADEVRQLAHNTQKATEQISEMIISLQKASDITVTSMETASSKAIISVDSAKSSAKAIENIANIISEIADMNITVSTSTDQQTTAAKEIDLNISEFSNSIKSVSQSSTENATTSQTLKKLADNLSKNISTFTV